MATAVAEFVEFLDDRRPPLLLADSLSYVLRTEPPVRLGTQRVVELVGDWAEARAAANPAVLVSDLLLSATARIIEAYRSNTISGFDPKIFYRPFVLGLTARVPPDQREAFQAGLRLLQTSVGQRWREREASEYEQTDYVQLRGRQLTIEQAVEEILGRLVHQPHMTDEEFQGAVEDLDTVLASRIGLPVHTLLFRIAVAATAYFNLSLVPRAARLIDVVVSAFERLDIKPNRRAEVRDALGGGVLDRKILATWLSDDARRAQVEPLVRFAPDLEPAVLVETLLHDQRAERRRIARGALVIYGAELLDELIRLLKSREVRLGPPEALRDVLYLVSQAAGDDRVNRRKAVEALAAHATAPDLATRTAAITALRRVGRGEAVSGLVRVLDAAAYADATAIPPEELMQSLHHALAGLAEIGLDPSLALVAEVAVGSRGEAFELGRQLRAVAIDVLKGRKAPLPPNTARVLSTYLASLEKRRLKFVLGGIGLGMDVGLVRGILELLSDQTDAAVLEVVNSPFMRRVAAKGGTGLLG